MDASGQDLSQGLITWDFAKVTRDIQGKETNETITYSVNSKISKIEYTNEIIYIDYAKYALYRYNKLERSCLKFPLHSNPVTEAADTKENLRKRNIALVGSLKRITTTKQKEIAHYNCSLQHIIFGAELAIFQMVTPLVITEFNQDFTESVMSCWVSREVVGFRALLNINQQRREVFQNNPLLRQVDIVGLLEILDGFPVQIIHKFHKMDFEITLLTHPSPMDDKNIVLIPHECISTP